MGVDALSRRVVKREPYSDLHKRVNVIVVYFVLQPITVHDKTKALQ